MGDTMQRQLVLEDGSVFLGEAFGAAGDTTGEVVFTTSMTGYQEVLSDPSYCRQIITFTYPLVGNYGISRDDFESIHPAASGIIVREACTHPSSFRSRRTLDDLLREHGIPGLQGIDTRRLTRILREHGTMRGAMCSPSQDPAAVAQQLRESPLPTDQVAAVSTKEPFFCPGRGPRVVVIDYGCKHGILRDLLSRGSEVIVVPYNASADDVLRHQPDGLVLSNGPGDPRSIPEAVFTLQQLKEKLPILGICLGHQLLALAFGAAVEKMKFGHRGGNHPVKDLRNSTVRITSQNHGYVITGDSLAATELELTHLNVNDGTVEGFCHPVLPIHSFQYHPESSPGPEDTKELFDRFFTLMQQRRPAHA